MATGTSGYLSLQALQGRYNDAISQQIEVAVSALHDEWYRPRGMIRARIKQLQDAISARESAGLPVDSTWLAGLQSLKETLRVVEQAAQDYANNAQAALASGQMDAIDLGSDAAMAQLNASMPEGLGYTFGVPPQDALDAMADATAEDSPLAALFSGMGADTSAAFRQALMNGINLGQGAQQIADALVAATEMTAQRAEVIARTELLRSYRDSQMANYRANSNVVRGWIWSADFSDRTCSACLAMDGTFHDLSEDLDDHIMGRCSALPQTVGWDDILGQLGLDASDLPDTALAQAQEGVNGTKWLDQQPYATLKDIMGPAKANAYIAGDLDLAQLVKIEHDPVWGDHIYEPSMRELGMNPRYYLDSAPVEPADWEAQHVADLAAGVGMEEPPELFGRGMASDTGLSEWDMQRQAAIDRALGREGAEGEGFALREPPVARDTFSIERMSADEIAQERQAAMAAIHPTDDYQAAIVAKEQVAKDLAARLEDNPDFQRVVDKIVDQSDLPTALRDQVMAGMTREEYAASELIRAWAQFEEEPLFPALQQAIRDEFGLTQASAMPKDAFVRSSLKEWRDVQPGLRAFVREMYNNTQDWLRANDIDEMVLYRGMAWDKLPKADATILDGAEHNATVTLRAASSFTADMEQARAFSSSPISYLAAPYQEVIAARVPAELILATNQTGFGSFDEYEAVVLGGQYDAVLVGTADKTAITAEQVDGLLTSQATEAAQSATEAATTEATEQAVTAAGAPFTADQLIEALASPDAQVLGGTNSAQLVTIDGQQYVAKQMRDAFGAEGTGLHAAQAEATAPQIAQLLGFGDYMTPTYMLESSDGTVYVASQFVADARPLIGADPAIIRSIPDAQYADITLLNVVLGETDANNANLLYDATTGNLVSIDHGYSLLGPTTTVSNYDAAAYYWHMKAVGASTFDEAWANTSGYDLLRYDTATLARVIDSEDAVVAAARDAGLEIAIPGIESRFELLRELAQQDNPTYASLDLLIQQEAGRSYLQRMQLLEQAQQDAENAGEGNGEFQRLIDQMMRENDANAGLATDLAEQAGEDEDKDTWRDADW